MLNITTWWLDSGKEGKEGAKTGGVAFSKA
jgi:hypothetical protein